MHTIHYNFVNFAKQFAPPLKKTMTKAFPNERWKTVHLPIVCASNFSLQVSNLGRIKSFNKNKPNGSILKGSITNGYPIIRLKLFKIRSEKKAAELLHLKNKIVALQTKIKKQLLSKKETNIQEAKDVLKKTETKYKALQKLDEKERIVNYHSLIHRLVANHFLPKPKTNETIVGHLNFDKTNNKVNNLKWMTASENVAHQQQNPALKDNDSARKDTRSYAKNVKLSVTRVMLLKKLIIQGKPTKTLVKQFKITETQISRIKKGENWADIPAAN
jgi:NUMOD4 motif/HNH endonuclease